ncbi:MAG: cytochrome c [Betaproteobacteria bacterium]|nr:cytochrome c [Betaproteobacteria bacterium]MDH4293532.1 cytochrome c [Betaproteobacteria bacterium]
METIGLPLVVIVLTCLLIPSAASASGNAARGEYMVRLGGCHSCHTESRNNSEPLAGGVALTTPFGTFHVPNITPDAETGIGRWSDGDFIRAMTEGISPDGRHYYPAFPYTSYTRMTRQDLMDLKAYLNTLKPVRRKTPPHELRFPYNLRAALGIWKFLFFRKGDYTPDAIKSSSWNRGAYIVTGPAHCGECHTRRNFLGATVKNDALAGTRKGPDGGRIPNITPHPKEGIGLWSARDIASFLKTGVPPFGEDVGDPMDKVITNSTSKWTDEDLQAVTEYLRSLPASTTP